MYAMAAYSVHVDQKGLVEVVAKLRHSPSQHGLFMERRWLSRPLLRCAMLNIGKRYSFASY